MKIQVEFDVPDKAKNFQVSIDSIWRENGHIEYETQTKYTKDVVIINKGSGN